MRSVLGIDAAWTDRQPSGVALVDETGEGWKIVEVAPSYEHFFSHAATGRLPASRPMGSTPSARLLLDTCRGTLGRDPTLVAVDMPMSYEPITGRRTADTLVSKAYGAKKCSTHSPSALRPGALSDRLREAFAEEGYPLLTQGSNDFSRGLLEVYPHPALLKLTGARERLKYKTSRARKYWPTHTPEERARRLMEQWETIARALDQRIRGVEGALSELEPPTSGVSRKAYEDAIDAIVCCWVGICVLEGNALALGDKNAAIWIPDCAEVQ